MASLAEEGVGRLQIYVHANGAATKVKDAKAVYFPTCDLLDAEVGASPSRAWRAAVDGVHALRHGLIRRIGPGESTRICDMPWISRDGPMLPMGAARSDSPQLVSELIDQTSRRWDRHIVRGYFSRWIGKLLKIFL